MKKIIVFLILISFATPCLAEPNYSFTKSTDKETDVVYGGLGEDYYTSKKADAHDTQKYLMYIDIGTNPDGSKYPILNYLNSETAKYEFNRELYGL